jgi:hypothetical protein
MNQVLRSIVAGILTCFVCSHAQQAIGPGQPSTPWAFAVNVPISQATLSSPVLLAELTRQQISTVVLARKEVSQMPPCVVTT